jgi:predicted DNA-binding transcriptional regulator YafY
MEEGFFVPSLNFEGDELEALALGAKLVMARSGDTLAAAAQRASAKIASALGDTLRHEFLNSTLEAGPSRTTMDGATGALHDELRRAIRDRAVLKIRYLSLSGEKTTRLARPLGLTVFDSAWLLTIWCERSKDFRHLRVDRIRSAVRTGENFRHERGKKFADALAQERSRVDQG